MNEQNLNLKWANNRALEGFVEIADTAIQSAKTITDENVPEYKIIDELRYAIALLRDGKMPAVLGLSQEELFLLRIAISCYIDPVGSLVAKEDKRILRHVRMRLTSFWKPE